MIPLLLTWIRTELRYIAEHPNEDRKHRESKLDLYRKLDEILTSYVTMTVPQTSTDCLLDVWRLKQDMIEKGEHDAHMLRTIKGACQLLDYAFSTPDQD